MPGTTRASIKRYLDQANNNLDRALNDLAGAKSEFPEEGYEKYHAAIDMIAQSIILTQDTLNQFNQTV